jgi:RimJ/RimL family protein N-acetyltransferase
MNKHDTFDSERLYYRGINEEDTDCLVKWRSKPEVYKYFKNPVPITKESHNQWYENSYLHDLLRYDYIIFDKAKAIKEKIGCIGVSKINIPDKCFEISYIIGEAFQRRGYATESIVTILCKMRSEGFTTVYADIHKNNIASIKTIQKLNFIESSRQGDFIMYACTELNSLIISSCCNIIKDGNF